MCGTLEGKIHALLLGVSFKRKTLSSFLVMMEPHKKNIYISSDLIQEKMFGSKNGCHFITFTTTTNVGAIPQRWCCSHTQELSHGSGVLGEEQQDEDGEHNDQQQHHTEADPQLVLRHQRRNAAALLLHPADRLVLGGGGR